MQKHTKSIEDYIHSCKVSPPSNSKFHHFITYIDMEMLKIDKNTGLPFYRSYLDHIIKTATGDSKMPFKTKEVWKSCKDGGINPEWSELKKIPDSELEKMKKNNDVYFAMVDIELHPNFKYYTPTELELLGRIEKLEEMVENLTKQLKQAK